MADALKAQGNAAFAAGKYDEAVSLFSEAIKLDPHNHVLFSNRSAAQASLQHYDKALEDAKQCVSLKPEWPKGYSRLGAAYHGLEMWGDAIEAYEKGLKLDPASQQLQTALKEATEAKAAASKPTGLFGPEALGKLAMDPRTREYLSQPDFLAMLRDISTNPTHMNQYVKDPRFQKALEVIFGFSMATPEADKPAAEPQPTAEAPASSTPPPSSSSKAPAPEASPKPEPEEEMDEEQREKERRKKEAQHFKEQGNDHYKKKEFHQAVDQYNKALELYDEDISFLTNRAAVYYEMGEFEKCLEDCDKAVERGRELRADYKIIARALTRKGNALVQLGQLEEAIQVYNKSLTEHRNADTLKRLNDTERALKEMKEKAYINMELSAEEKDMGNTAFKEQRYPEAVQHYTEALKRGPPQVNPEAFKLYSNLAASYTKLTAFNEALKSAEKCIELNPKFGKGYSRKATVQFFMKEYDKALETYRAGLKEDPGNEELQEGVRRCMEAISRFAAGDASADEIKERQARAMADPEVQQILMDPVMRQVLTDFQENPKAAQAHLKHPEIMTKVNKLVAAGIIQIR